MNGLELQDILLTFPEGGRRRTVLDIPYLKVTSGEHIGIRGASGSGKSSLLNVVSGLVLPDRGTVRWGATVPGALSEHERDRWRGQHIGFVFQDFQLFPELEALENVLLPATFTGWRIPGASCSNKCTSAPPGKYGRCRVGKSSGSPLRGPCYSNRASFWRTSPRQALTKPTPGR